MTSKAELTSEASLGLPSSEPRSGNRSYCLWDDGPKYHHDHVSNEHARPVSRSRWNRTEIDCLPSSGRWSLVGSAALDFRKSEATPGQACFQRSKATREPAADGIAHGIHRPYGSCVRRYCRGHDEPPYR